MLEILDLSNEVLALQSTQTIFRENGCEKKCECKTFLQ